jgi:hypothetical protein
MKNYIAAFLLIAGSASAVMQSTPLTPITPTPTPAPVVVSPPYLGTHPTQELTAFQQLYEQANPSPPLAPIGGMAHTYTPPAPIITPPPFLLTTRPDPRQNAHRL